MRFGACPREKEVSGLLARGHWPQAQTSELSPELRAHVAGCRSCRDLVLVRQAFRADRAVAAAAARLESPGVLWWRAQLRRRNAALERIARPIVGAQIFAVVVSLVAAVIFLAFLARRGVNWLAWVAELPRVLHFAALTPGGLDKMPWETWLLLAGAAFAVMSGVVVYIASERR